MENFEQNRDPIEEEHRRSLENEEFVEEIREDFASELDFVSPDLAERVREGEMAEWSSQDAKEALDKVAEMKGLRDRIDELEEIFLKKDDEDF